MFAWVTSQVAFPGLPHRRGAWCFADLGRASGWRCSPARAERLYTSSRPPQHLQLCQSAVYNRLLHQQAGFCSSVLGYVFTRYQVKSSLLYCQFCHMYSTYIQRIEIALLSDPWCIQLILNTDGRRTNTDKYSLNICTYKLYRYTNEDIVEKKAIDKVA